MGIAAGALELVAVDATSRDVVPGQPVEGYYRSLDPRLLVVDKANGGKADALNVGLNHCRYRYVCGVDADMVFAPTALTRAMREISGDPEHIVGLTSYFENARDPVRVLENGLQAAGPTRGRCSRSRRSTTCGRSSTTARRGHA